MPTPRTLLVVLFSCLFLPIGAGAASGWTTVVLFGQDRVVGGFVAGTVPVLWANLALSQMHPLLQRERPSIEPPPFSVRLTLSMLTWMYAMQAYILLCPPL